jgi:hypothetical protein
MNRRGFFSQLASGILVASGPTLFLPRLTKVRWKKGMWSFETDPWVPEYPAFTFNDYLGQWTFQGYYQDMNIEVFALTHPINAKPNPDYISVTPPPPATASSPPH